MGSPAGEPATDSVVIPERKRHGFKGLTADRTKFHK